jgi:hypothetical protein
MTASAIERDTREDTDTWPWASLRIDFGTYEAFHDGLDSPGEPRLVRW